MGTVKNPIPSTLWEVFCARWLPVDKAPADAREWLDQGYLHLVPQGKIMGYAVTLAAYEWIVGE